MRNKIISYKMLIAKEETKKSNFRHSEETLIKLSKSTSPSNRTDQCHMLRDTVRTTVELLCYLKINNMNPIINIGQTKFYNTTGLRPVNNKIMQVKKRPRHCSPLKIQEI